MIINRLCHRTPLHGYLLISNLVYLAAVRASYLQEFAINRISAAAAATGR